MDQKKQTRYVILNQKISKMTVLSILRRHFAKPIKYAHTIRPQGVVTHAKTFPIQNAKK